jgi:hypothetical protein
MAFLRPFLTDNNEMTPENHEIVEEHNNIAENIETNLEFKNQHLHVQSQRIVLNIYERLKSILPLFQKYFNCKVPK